MIDGIGLVLAGALTSCGPCLAPRALAVAALGAHGGRRRPAAAAFVAGTAAGYVLMGFSVGGIAPLIAGSQTAYGLLAAGLALTGATMLLRDAGCAAHSTHRLSLGGAAGLGAASVLVLSPCCTPIVFAVAATAGTDGALRAALALAAFAGGHLTPVVVCAVLGERAARAVGRIAGAQPAVTVAGALTLALGAYYALLA